MKVRYQADADLNEDIVTGVQRRVPEIDFQTAQEAQLANLPDPDVLAQAAQEGRILLTHDRRTMPTTLDNSSRITTARALSSSHKMQTCCWQLES